jgi:hypothetical protein
MEARAHIQEPCENQSDFSHFAFFHKGTLFRAMVAFQVLPRFQRSERHQRHGSFSSTVSVLGRPIYTFDTNIAQVGPGLMHQFNHFFAPSIIISAFTPIDESRMMIVRQSFTTRRLPSLLTRKLFDEAQALQAERDVEIWNHKVYRPQPILIKEDGPILEARKWFAQFYA